MNKSGTEEREQARQRGQGPEQCTAAMSLRTALLSRRCQTLKD